MACVRPTYNANRPHTNNRAQTGNSRRPMFLLPYVQVPQCAHAPQSGQYTSAKHAKENTTKEQQSETI